MVSMTLIHNDILIQKFNLFFKEFAGCIFTRELYRITFALALFELDPMVDK